ncbi:MAG: ABC transporter ATP-binding protein [Suipraeoptans sp.]
MKRLLKYLNGYYKESIIAPFFKMLEAGFELLIPLVTAGIIDYGIKNGDTRYIWSRCIILVSLGIIGLVCSLTAQYFAAKAGMGFGANVRQAIFIHINKLGYKELDNIGASTLITRITGDVNQLQTGVNLFLRLFLRSPFIALGAIIMSLSISPTMTVIFIIAMIFISLAIFLIIRVTVPAYKKIQSYLDKIVLHTRENFSGIRVIRAFEGQRTETGEFEDDNDGLKKLQIAVGRISGLMNPITFTLANLGIIAVIYIGKNLVYNGSITQGEIVALINYMTQVLQALLVIANLIITVSKATASANRVSEFLSIKPEMKEGSNKEEITINEIEFKHVGFLYSGSDEQALSDISFKIERGQTLGIIGGTGSGKSTLINLIPRFYDANTGEILVNRKNVSDYKYNSVRKHVKIVPQKSILFSGTIRDNIKWGDDFASDHEIIKALEEAQALEFVSQKDGLETKVQQGGNNFSGGQKQRLCIARALVGKPDVLILDDSSSALDYGTEAKLRKSLNSGKENRITIVVSQRVSAVRESDVIIVLEEGVLVGIGSHDILIRECGVYKEIYTSQTNGEEAADYA